MLGYFGYMALSACITEGKLEPQKESLEPTCVYIFLAQKPRSEDLLFFPLPFCFFFTLLTTNFFPILNVLALTKNGTVIVKQSPVSSLLKF